MCFAPQRRALFRHLNCQKWSGAGAFSTFWLRNVLRATTACTFSTSQLPKVVRRRCVLYILTSKCASRHNGVHFFDIATSKSGPTLVCFVHFDYEMCFAPQRRALFRHLNCQKWSGAGAFSTFWLRNVLRATTACNFSSLIWPAGSAPAALASLLFDHPEPQIIGKTQCFATFLPFHASASSFFLYSFSSIIRFFLLIFLFSLPLPCSAFHLSILSEVWLLNFLRQTDMTTCLETFEKERFCSFPHRHSARVETRHVGAAKRAFRARHSPILTLSTRYQTGWNVTKCHACHAKRHDNLLGNLRKGDVLQLPPKTRRRHRKTRDSRRDTWAQQNEHFVQDILQFWHLRQVSKQVGMSQSVTPATQNDMTTCLETFEKEMFCSFPHRHGDATGKPETRDETRGRSKTSITCEKSSNFDTCGT